MPVAFDDEPKTGNVTPPSRERLICEAAAQALLSALPLIALFQGT